MAEGGAARKKGKKNRKWGRKGRRPSHKLYNAQQRWVRNKARRIAKQLRKFPNYKPFNLSDEVQLYLTKLLAKN